MEQRDAGSVLEAVRVIFEVVGDTQLIWSVVRKFKSRAPRAEVEAPPAPDAFVGHLDTIVSHLRRQAPQR
jgi:hypothetical protein